MCTNLPVTSGGCNTAVKITSISDDLLNHDFTIVTPAQIAKLKICPSKCDSGCACGCETPEFPPCDIKSGAGSELNLNYEG